ncbi:LA2681 family HEPN domain-containing protein [Paenibacillus polymyxa]|uniref:LA2681 family HEPN domain-containing protein n=1 Tax=Paenibacillus polymyxa TaxID=1406 RepID=UPI002AB32939|nr:LA2681 family HEPN domain-containing protein [Paenibacillus polymyxa]MDY8045288.1 LA2681 family HEPN domain-containing protein [Paenibacillus polymyxa]
MNPNVLSIAIRADKAFDDQDIQTLETIVEECLGHVNLSEYNDLEKAIFAYHGATSQGNKIDLIYNGLLEYSDEKNNEEEFELSLYLFRISLELFNKYKNDKKQWDSATREDEYYYSGYLLMTTTNYANELHRSGRLIKSIDQLKFGVSQGFPMAIGNMGLKLITYARNDYDDGHKQVLLNEAQQLLLKALDSPDLDDHARRSFNIEVERIRDWVSQNIFDEFSLGTTEQEQDYRKWCLDNNLFLNTLNDYFNVSMVACDCLHLPDIVTDINIGPKYHGLFNQLKQEYVSARFMIYEGINDNTPHFSDKEVFIYNTLDYPIYGIGIEKIKFGCRSLYSIFDRIAYFINDYFDIGIKEQDVSYKSIWQNKKFGRQGYDFKIDLKKRITDQDTYNFPGIGFYWLCKDIAKKQVKHKYLDPSIEVLSGIRNALEHRYLKIHDPFIHRTDSFKDTLAQSVHLIDFKSATLELMKYSREAIILLSLLVNREEQIRSKTQGDKFVMPITMDAYYDDWKTL